jgi:NodT family efflux transporter outer membrane factor (OMF) lipoprotein
MYAKRLPGTAVTLTTAALVAGCAVGPDFKRPDPPQVDRYTRQPLAAQTSSSDVAGGESQRFVREMDIPGKWWTLFRSPGLNAVIEQALKANPTLDSAMAAMQQAGENVHAQEGKWFPLVQANYTPMRQQVSQVLSAPLAAPGYTFNLHTAQVLVSYPLDVWGLNKRTVESLQAQAESQRFQVEAAYLTLTSNVVAAAVQEASLRDQIAATHKLIDLNADMLGILQRQLATGYENRIDVAAQEAQLAQIRATLPPLEKALAQQRDLVTALTGRFPSEEPREKFELASLHLPRELPVSLPSKLIAQRPDVRSAEELLHSASAQVGVAVANMLPNLTINGNWGYTSTALPGLISPASEFWTLAGSATQPVFDGFTLLHQKRAAEDGYDQAAATYRSTVIGALQNVADTLHALEEDANALKAAVEWEHAAKVSLDLTRQQMQSGYINVLLLLTAEVSYQQAVLAVVQARAGRLADVVALYQALGGGWWNREDAPPPKPLIVATNRPVAAKPVAAAMPVSPTPSLPVRADLSNRFELVQVDARTQFQLLYETDRRADSAVSSTAGEASSDNPIDHISAVFHDFNDERER